MVDVIKPTTSMVFRLDQDSAFLVYEGTA